MPLSTAITQADVTAIAPELGGSALNNDTWTAILADVTEQVNESAFPSAAAARRAAAYLAAHLATFSMAKGGTGGSAPVQSETVGEVSRTYAISVASDVGNLQSTGYGREWLRRCRLNGGFLVL